MTSACHAEPQAKHLAEKGKRSFVGTQDDKQKTQDSSLQLLACAATEAISLYVVRSLRALRRQVLVMLSRRRSISQKKEKDPSLALRMTSKRRKIRHCDCLRAPATEAISLPTNRKAAWSFDSSSRAQRGDLPICGKFAACFAMTSACHAEPQAKHLAEKGEDPSLALRMTSKRRGIRHRERSVAISLYVGSSLRALR